MLRWVRLVLSILAVVGLLAAAPGAAVAKTQQQTHHHHCMDMPDGDCPDQNAGATPACCIASACAFVQPALPGAGAAFSLVDLALVDLPLRDDKRLSSLSVPPDIRPPIA